MFVSYAQNCEDVILWRALKHVENGFYIDVGANDPVVDSVTKAFYDKGWRGINIEPIKSHHQNLLEARPNDINLLCAAGFEHGQVDIWECDVRGWATASSDVIHQHEQAGHTGVLHKVPVFPLADICEQHAQGEIHFLKIDVEGLEKDVLLGMNFKKFRPWIVVVEATKPNSTEEIHGDWEALVVSNDYVFAYADGLNRFYISKEQAPNLLNALSYPPNIFDEYILASHYDSILSVQAAEAQAEQARERVVNAETLAQESQERAVNVEALAQESQERAVNAETKARQAQERINGFLNSTSWRITAPLRWLVDQLSLLRIYGFKQRLKAAIKKILRKVILLVVTRPKLKRLATQVAYKIGVADQLKYLIHSSSHLKINLIPNHLISLNGIRYSGPYGGRRVAVLAPISAEGVVGGAERFYSGLLKSLRNFGCKVDLLEIIFDESTFENIQKGYRDFAELDLSKYDLVISTKAPSYVVNHPNHILYLVHTVRVFYDMFDNAFPQANEVLKSQQAWIQYNDSIAFQRIKNRFSIGWEVTKRLETSNNCSAEVLHPPVDLDGLYDAGIGDYFYMPGRLHSWKRVDLAIRAIKLSSLPMRLLISGSGDAESELRALANGDRRIEFLGRVDDDQLRKLYAESLAVSFLPVREDYGYITLEAFASGKPVITSIDSGEPIVFVENEVTGLVCEPNEESVKRAMEKLWLDRELAAKMGRVAKERISEMTWPSVASRLLKAGFPEIPVPIKKTKMKVAILDMQPIIPAVGGGRIRLLGLYHALGNNIDARYVGTYDWPGEKYRRHQVTPTLEEIDVPLSKAHHLAASEASLKAGGKVVIDMLFGQQAHLSPAYIEEVVRAVHWADVVVFSHPWVAPLISDKLLKDKIVVYDAQNVEGRLRAQILDQSDSFQKSILDEVRFAERLVGNRSDLILTCSDDDSDGFFQDYGWSKASMVVAPNGVFCESIKPPVLGLKAQTRERLGISPKFSGVAFFIGSDYAPNVEAANIIIQLIAPACPQVQFVIAGGVCARIDAAGVNNVSLVGFVNDSQRLLWLHAADFAINPMRSGSGTNIKMFDFMAAGLPIVSTPIGARGIVNASTAGIVLAECQDMPAAISNLLTSPQELSLVGVENRRFVEESFSWEKISPRLGKQLRRALIQRKGNELLDISRDRSVNRIAHLTTLGMKCGIGEYTRKIIDTFNSKGFKNLVVSCDSAEKPATPYESVDRFDLGWYYDNVHWVDSYIKPDVIEKVLGWGAQGILIQYHPAFYSTATLLEFAKGCAIKGLSTVIVVHNYAGCSPAVFYELNCLGVTILSHREDDVLEAEKQGVEIELLPLGVDVRLPLKKRDISARDMLKQPPMIITNGFLRGHKGIRLLIKAMPRILEKYPGAKLRVQCAIYPNQDSTKEFEVCRKIVDVLGLKDCVVFDTQFLAKKELLDELSKADIAVLPYESSNEGGSAAATDAFAVGLPLIISDAKIFDSIRYACLTIKPKEEEISKAILDVLSSKEKYKMLADLASKYSELNSWEQVSGIYLTGLSNQKGLSSGSKSNV